MHSSQLRQDHIHGMLLGIAIGDALGYARRGLTRRQAIRILGGGPTRYQFVRNRGVTGFNSSQAFMAAQSIVSSGTEIEQFGKNFLRRLGWYSLSLPPDIKSASRSMGLKSWLRRIKEFEPSNSLGNDPATRTIVLVLALHNTNLGARNWIEHAVTLTHQHPLVVDGCHIIAGLTNLIINERGELNAPAAAKFLSDMPWNRDYCQGLKKIVDYLERNYSAAKVAKRFGWEDGVPTEMLPTVLMSVFCFLRHHKNFQLAVDSAVRLGGDTSTMGAVVGGLAGAHLGVRYIPMALKQSLSDRGYGPTWIDAMSERLATWPHGSDDLLDAPAMPAEPLSIVRSNLSRRLRGGIKSVVRWPRKVLTK